eukprot:2841752-Prymnesium_polylepis.1
MSLPKVPPKISRTVLTWWPTGDGSSLSFSHAIYCVGPACPTRSPCRGASRGGPLACRRRARDGCACGGRSSGRRP